MRNLHVACCVVMIRISDVIKTKFLRPKAGQNNKTKTTGSTQRNVADITFK